MKVALIHDYLNQFGGAERVLEALLAMFPEAHLYTLFHDAERTGGRFSNALHRTSFLDHSFVCRHHRLFIPLMPFAIRTLFLNDEYDLIISDTAGFAKGIRYTANGRRPFHLAYCHTPLRYAWETHSYFNSGAFITSARPLLWFLKQWDFRAAQRPDALVANSKFIAGKIRAYYGRDATVVYPPIADKLFMTHKHKRIDEKQKPYYLSVGRLLSYKRVDLVIEAFRVLGLPLKVVGVGPESRRLWAKASGFSNIEFLSFVSDAELLALYRNARALIVPQVEDFGLVTAEAQACGTPVVAIAAGGSLEIVIDGATGVFFHSQRASDIISAIRRLERISLRRTAISRAAQRFSFNQFRDGMFSVLDAHGVYLKT